MKNRQLLKVATKCCMGILLSLFHLNVNAQLAIKFDTSTSELYLFEINAGVPKYLDTLYSLRNYYYSFHLRDKQLFRCWFVNDFINPVYIVDLWEINERGKIVHVSKYLVSLKKYHGFKEHFMKMSLNETGVRMCFEKGSIREVVISYSNLEKESKLTNTLKRIAKMLDAPYSE